MRIRLCLFTLVLSLLAPRLSAGASRQQAPDPATEAKLRHAVQSQYSEMYAGPERADQLALSRLLCKASGEADTPQQSYALLCEARDAAARAGDLASAYRICDSLVA